MLKVFRRAVANTNEKSRLSFQGSSAAEAEDFVQAVRRKACAEEKEFDYKWMAAYAASRMSGQALRWHMGLPRDVQSDWGKLEVAILDRFAPNQTPAAPSQPPAAPYQPPAAPSNDAINPKGAPAQSTLRTGRIRITERDTGLFLGYVSKEMAKEDPNYHKDTPITTQFDDALLVEFEPSASAITFDLVDKSKYHRLALRVIGELELNADPSSTKSLRLVCFAPGPKPWSIRYASPVPMGDIAHVQHAVWKVDLDGTINLIWPSSPRVEIGASVNKPPNGLLYLRSHMTAMMNNDYARSSYTRVKLEFERA